MNKKISMVLMILVISILSGCAHCSVTTTNFDGKTKGFNPYGDGDVDVIREAYWGFKECILKLVERSMGENIDDVILTAEDSDDKPE